MTLNREQSRDLTRRLPERPQELNGVDIYDTDAVAQLRAKLTNAQRAEVDRFIDLSKKRQAARDKLADAETKLMRQELTDRQKEAKDRAKQRIEKRRSDFQSLSAGASNIGQAALGANAAVLAVGMKGFSGTVEMERFQAAIEKVGQAIAVHLNPYLTGITSVIEYVAGAIRSMDAETAKTVASWMALGAAVGTGLVLFPAVASVVTALTSALVLLISPAGLIVAAIVGVGVALVNVLSPMITFQDAMATIIGFVLEKWELLVTAIKMAGAAALSVAQNMGTAIDNIINGRDIGAGQVDIVAQMQRMAAEGLQKSEQRKKDGEQIGKNLAASILAIKSDFLTGVDALKQSLSGVGGAFNKGFREGENTNGPRLKFNSALESSQGTFDRLLVNFSNIDPLQVEKAQLVQLKDANANLQQMANGLEQIAAKLPAVR
jgi:hypothetical protein